MDYVNLGSSGLKVSRICLGTMTYGTKQWRKWCLEEEEARPFYRRALELGINFFDTADMYSTGVCEEITGRALKEFGPGRDRLVITTKVLLPMSEDPNDRSLSRKHIMASIDRSLKRLGTDYVDIYMIHRFDASTPTEETLRALDDLVRAGKVLYLGASSMWAWQFAQMLAAQDAHGYSRFAVMQNHYNLIYREEEREMIPLCRKEGIGITPFSPLARGLVTGERKLANVGDTLRAQTDEYARRDYTTP
jgi:1-deoxyxylulose-5-phosphate synthase